MTTDLGILNVGAGDTKLVFDPNDPEGVKRAARIVRDMIRRGYSILVEGTDAYGKTAYVRAHDFDETKCEYIIADDTPQPEEQHGEASEIERGAPPPRRGRKPGWKRIAAGSSQAVAVGRTAGG